MCSKYTKEATCTAGSAGETCPPQKGGWPVRKSEDKSTLPILVDNTDRRRTVCVRPTPLGWGRGQRSNREFCGREQKKDRHARHARTSPGQATPTSHKERQATRKKGKPQFPGAKGNAGNARLPPAYQECQQTHGKKATCTGLLERLAAPKKVTGQ